MGEIIVKRGYLQLLLPYVPVIAVLVGWLLEPFGERGTLIFFLASLIALFGGSYYQYIQLKVKEAEKAKELISLHRHDLMNHIQVLMGYLSMKRIDPMKTYIEQMVRRAQGERLVSEFRYAPLAVTLLTLPHRFNSWQVDIQIEESIRFSHQTAEKKLLMIVNQVLPWLDYKLQKDQAFIKNLVIHLARSEQGIRLTAKIVEEQGKNVSLFSYSREWIKLKQSVKKWDGDLRLSPDGKGLIIDCQA